MSVPGFGSRRIIEARSHERLDLVHHGEFHRSNLQNLGAERSHFEHFLEGHAIETAGFGHDPRIGRIDAVDIGINVASIGMNGGRHGDRAGVGTAAAERRDPSGLLVETLKAGDHRNLAAGEAPDDLGSVDRQDARRTMRIVGQDRDLPALPGARRNADILQHDGEQPGSDLFARRHDRIIFARIVQHGSLAAPGDEFVGLAGHRRNHDRDLMAGLHLAFDVARDVADALDIGDRRAAEFHHETGHGSL